MKFLDHPNIGKYIFLVCFELNFMNIKLIGNLVDVLRNLCSLHHKQSLLHRLSFNINFVPYRKLETRTYSPL